MQLFKEKRQYFIDPRDALADGLVAVDDRIDVDRLFEAYSLGIFPWPQEGFPILWFCPPRRGILELNDYCPSRSLLKLLKKDPFTISMNKCFSQVIAECRKASRPGQDGTWITGRIEQAYLDFHREGYAHSIEAWEGDNLVGGMYGVYMAGLFCGESMFYKKNNASKACLHFLIQFLIDHGHTWMDVQMVTPYLESIGAKYISREDFLNKLDKQKKNLNPAANLVFG